MRGVAALLLAAGCNPYFGIDRTRLADGNEPDAPFACPTDRPLRFSTLLHIAYPQRCQEFSLAAASDLGVAVCTENFVNRVFEASGSNPLTESAGIDYTPVSYSEIFHAPRLSPDANELYVRVDDYDLDGLQVLTTRYDSYARSGGGWTATGTLAFANQADDALSNIALQPDASARALLLRRSGLTEWVKRDGTWGLDRTYPMTFAPLLFFSPMLSRDGLQLIAIGGPSYSQLAVLWASHPSVDAAFTTLSSLPDLPVPEDRTIYLTDNCGRAYFTGLESVFYAQQQ